MTEVAFDLDGYLRARAVPVEAALERAVRRVAPHLPPAVADAVHHGVTGGGKRLRPILCVTAWEACGGAERDEAYDLAASLELIHAYSLVHDDLPCMDDAELRRGRPTTHRVHGEDVAMRAGAALIPAAALQARRAALALGCDEGRAARVARLLMEAAGAGGMVGGQWLDLEGEEESLDAAALDRLHGMKTGALLVASLTVGATAAGAEPERVEALEGYGRRIGLAFQAADDILDATQEAEVLGKNPSDAALDKSTYVSLHGLDQARRAARELTAAAKDRLRRAGVDAPALEALADFVVNRRN